MGKAASAGEVRRIALIGNCPPRMCGIATFTADVRKALEIAEPDVEVDVYAMNDPGNTYAYGDAVRCAIQQDQIGDYYAAAHHINESGADVVVVQHEYGIFGGPAGNLLLKLLDRVDAPVVISLHTVLENPDVDQRAVVDALARRASKLIVLAEKGREILMRVHGISSDRIAVVLHGVPDRPLIAPDAVKPRFGFDGRKVVLTFGLLSPNKGIETIVKALPAIRDRHPEVLYVVLGATHPHLVAREGESYREGLVEMAKSLGVGENIRFIDGFLELQELLDYIQAADIYATPYLNEAQIVSGTLSYAVALGKPVVSTPYWHAAELITPDIGMLVPFNSSEGFSSAINTLLDSPEKLETMREQAWQVGRSMTWSCLADAYFDIMRAAASKRHVRLINKNAVPQRAVKPRLDGVERMTDSCGMMQHSIFMIPDRNHGYCVDDNARALMLMHAITGQDQDRADELALIYASFVQHAWNGDRGRFRNFMSYERTWLEEEGSQDSFGRSLWAIATTAVAARSPDLRRWGLHLFDQVAPHASALTPLRSRAFVILAADALLSTHSTHPIARALVAELAPHLSDALQSASRSGWRWFEPTLSYDNSRLPEALIRAGRVLGNDRYVKAGLEALVWLDGVHTTSAGHFRAVGTDSFHNPYQSPLPFDQQPLEAWAMIDSAAFAHEVTGDEKWIASARRAYLWYVGENDVGVPIATIGDGGCFDGLMSDRANLNQGAESVLSFQFACAAMEKMEGSAGKNLSDQPVGQVAS